MTKLETKLLSILEAHGELAGREVAKIYKRDTGRSISYGTLYATFRRLVDGKVVNARDDSDEDGRVRFFSLPK